MFDTHVSAFAAVFCVYLWNWPSLLCTRMVSDWEELLSFVLGGENAP